MSKLTILSKSLILFIFWSFLMILCFWDIDKSTELSTKVERLWQNWEFCENWQFLRVCQFLINFDEKKQTFLNIEKSFRVNIWHRTRNEDADNAGENRRALALPSVEILTKNEFFENANFWQKMSFFSKTIGRIGLKLCMLLRKAILRKWNLKKGGTQKFWFFRKMEKITVYYPL